MRIWLNPDKLRSFRISAADVLARVRGQNVQFATGHWVNSLPCKDSRWWRRSRRKRSSAPRKNSKSGTGKTTLALQFLIEGAKRGEKGLYVTLSESERELRLVAKRHGFSLAGLSIFELVPPKRLLIPTGR